jgi:hypothetical protein
VALDMFYTSAILCRLSTTTTICNLDDDNDGPSKSSKATTDRASLPILRFPLSTLFKFSRLSHPLLHLLFLLLLPPLIPIGNFVGLDKVRLYGV